MIFSQPRNRSVEILDAALHVFDQRGFDAARIEDIARAAGVAKGAVYLHFASKEALLRALIQRHVAPIAENAAALAAAGMDDPLATIRTLMLTIAPRLRDPKVFAAPRLVISVANRFPEIAETYRVEVFDRVRGALTALVEAAIAQNRLRAVDPAIIVHALMGMAMLDAVRRHVFRDETAAADAAERRLDMLLSGFAKGEGGHEG